MAKRNDKDKWDLEAQNASAAQFLTYIASTGASNEKYEIRYEDENIWMSQKMLAQVYGIEVNSINYHIKKIFLDAELEEASVIRKIRITGSDRIFMSDYDRYLLELEEQIKNDETEKDKDSK